MTTATHDHQMRAGILAIPGVLSDAADPSRTPWNGLAADAAGQLPAGSTVDLVGCGTSLFAATALSYALEAAGVRACARNAHEYAAYPPPGDGLLVATSHTGRTPDVVAAAQAAAARGQPVVAITDDDGSPLAGLTSLVLTDPRGTEPALPKTRSYTSTLVRGLALARAAARRQGRAGADERLGAAVAAAAEHAGAVLADGDQQARELAPRFRDVSRIVVIGGGPETATAQEAALKLTETAAVHADAWEVEEAAHGTWASTGAGELVIVLTARGPSAAAARRAVAGMQAVGATVWAVGNDPEALDAAQLRTSLPDLDPLALPLLSILPLYWLAYQLALVRGFHPDIMRQDDPRYRHARAIMRRTLADDPPTATTGHAPS